MPDRERILPSGVIEEWGIDVERLTRWMAAEGLSDGAITRIAQIPGGSQNLLLRLEVAGAEYVLRRPPLHKRANSDETMMREARVLTALAGTDVPHPALVRACEDETVLGAAFYLMEVVDGADLWEAVAELRAGDPGAAHGVGLSIVDSLAAVARVDVERVGLAQFGRTDGWLGRQVSRWRAQLASYAELDGYQDGALPDVDSVAEWLEQSRPAQFVPGLMHGDFHSGNVMVSREMPVVTAIVDWELATLGSPLLDLANLFATWPDGREGEGVTPIIPDLPTRAELFARYSEGVGRRIEGFQWFRVLACYRLGIILEGTKARADAGRAPREIGDRLHDIAISLFRQADELIRNGAPDTYRS